MGVASQTCWDYIVIFREDQMVARLTYGFYIKILIIGSYMVVNSACDRTTYANRTKLNCGHHVSI
jgi:hypothetical protein